MALKPRISRGSTIVVSQTAHREEKDTEPGTLANTERSDDKEAVFGTLTSLVNDFMEEYGLKRIVAFSGGSDEPGLEGIDDPGLKEHLKVALHKKQELIIGQAISRLCSYRIAILCGGTKGGVPETTALAAKAAGLSTIGVYPARGRKHPLSPEALDLRICVESEMSHWGDESSVFAKLLDGVIVYGGSAGTLIEVAHVLKINDAILGKAQPIRGSTSQPRHAAGEAEESARLKLIVPIPGTGGVADGLPFIWGKQKVRLASIIQDNIQDQKNIGFRAAHLLANRLHLDRHLK
jgi:predicted Rossmann-fold nucleotide-binding protein